MRSHLWFRITGKMPGLGWPYYLGLGTAFNPHYNSVEVWQASMPEHVVVTICLSRGGAVAMGSQKRALEPGDVILRMVEDTELWEGYHPAHRGTWEFLGLIFSGEASVVAAKALMARYGRVYSLSLDHPLVRRLTHLLRDSHVVLEMTVATGVKLVNDVLLALLKAAEGHLQRRSGRIIDLAEAVEGKIRSDLSSPWRNSLFARVVTRRDESVIRGANRCLARSDTP